MRKTRCSKEVSEAAGSRSVQSAVAGSVARQKQQRQKQQQRWHVALEKNRFSEEHEAFLAQSAASRAEHAKEVEELKGTRSLTRHAMALQSHRCSLLQVDAVSEPLTSKLENSMKGTAGSRRTLVL